MGSVVYAPTEDRLYLDYRDRVRMVCSPALGEARISFRRDDDGSAGLASNSAFTLALLELLKRRGRYGLHAGGVCLHGRALLLAGRSGAGKTTLSLALLRAGYGFMGDDMCFLAPSPSGLRIQAFSDEVDLTENTLRLFPELRPHSDEKKRSGAGKIPLLPERAYEVRFEAACRPGLLVFPNVVDAERSRLVGMSSAQALLELAPNVLLTEASSSQSHLDALSELVDESPCYRLDSGRDLDRLPSLLADRMESLL